MFYYYLDCQQQFQQQMQLFQKIHESGSDLVLQTTALIISNEEIQDIKKMVKSLEESVLIIKGVSEKLKMK